MHCGACRRDLALVRHLQTLGHQVLLVPLYTPLRTDTDEPITPAPIFYNGLLVFLQQKLGFFQRIPNGMARALSSPALLRFLTRFALETRAEKLGAMTVSVLQGREGRQQRELARLLHFLESAERPDVVSLTNSLLSAIAPEVQQRLGVPVVCSLQGEEGFVEGMKEPHRTQARDLMRQHARTIRLFFAPTGAYADRMADFLQVPRAQIRVVRSGLEVATFRTDAPRHREPFTVGYLSAITGGKGLDLLVDAFCRLVKEDGRDATLRVAGPVLNRRYWRSVVGRLRKAGLLSRFEYVGEVDLEGKRAFLRRCSVFSVPSRFYEVRGMAAMEAMASGVPVVMPDTGVFPELIGLTGGGILFRSGDATSLARAIATLMDDPEAADAMGRAGAEGIACHFTAERMAEEFAAACAEVLAHPVPQKGQTA